MEIIGLVLVAWGLSDLFIGEGLDGELHDNKLVIWFGIALIVAGLALGI